MEAPDPPPDRGPDQLRATASCRALANHCMTRSASSHSSPSEVSLSGSPSKWPSTPANPRAPAPWGRGRADPAARMGVSRDRPLRGWPAARARRAARLSHLIVTPGLMPEVLATVRRLVRRPGLRPFVTDDMAWFTRDDPVLRTPPPTPEHCFMGCYAGLRDLRRGPPVPWRLHRAGCERPWPSPEPAPTASASPARSDPACTASSRMESGRVARLEPGREFLQILPIFERLVHTSHVQDRIEVCQNVAHGRPDGHPARQ